MADELPQWDIEIKEIPVEGDKVSVCGIDFVFGNWSPEENYTTPYNVQIENTVGRCCANLVAAINGADSKFGGGHLNRYISSVKASYLGRFAHIQMRNLTDNGSGVEVTASAGDRITVTKYEGNIPGGGGGGGGDEAVLVKKTVTENGTYNASEDSADGYSQVTVNVVPVLGTKEINTNGTYNASSDSLQGFSSVTVNVAPNVTTKSISENGTYNASSDSVDGYSEVTVSVPPPVLTSKSITANGVYTASSDSADGFSTVNVNVPVPTVLPQQTFTQNGRYIASQANPPQWVFNDIIVNVPGFMKPIHSNVSDGYVNRPSSGNETSWKIQLNSSNRSDIFQVKANTRYIFSLSNKVGNRFAILFSETDPYVSIQDVPGVYVNMLFNQGYNIAGAPGAYSHGYYTTPSDGFITITKTNKGEDINLYMIEIPTEATD